jgi:hypothetical protein
MTIHDRGREIRNLGWWVAQESPKELRDMETNAFRFFMEIKKKHAEKCPALKRHYLEVSDGFLKVGGVPLLPVFKIPTDTEKWGQLAPILHKMICEVMASDWVSRFKKPKAVSQALYDEWGEITEPSGEEQWESVSDQGSDGPESDGDSDSSENENTEKKKKKNREGAPSDVDMEAGSVAIPAETLIKHFSGIFYTDREPLLFVDPDWHFDHLSQDGVFTDAELLTAINDLNAQAAVGPERIPSSVLKEVFQDSSTRAPLLALMNLCFSQGTVPADWGLSEIFVLYKLKGSRDDPNNYRGINLINDFFKIYERLIEQRFQHWMFDSAPQGPMQFVLEKARVQRKRILLCQR